MQRPEDAAGRPFGGGSVYVALIENRAKEVGLAALRLDGLSLHLSQHIEPGRHYATARLALQIHAPTRVVLVGTNHHEVSASGLNKALMTADDGGSRHELVYMSRSSFDDTQGAAAVRELASASSTSSSSGDDDGSSSSTTTATTTAASVLAKTYYLAHGAAGALLRYASEQLGCIIRPHTLQVTYESASNQHMLLDTAAIESLEIVRPLHPVGQGGALPKAQGRRSVQAHAAAKGHSCLLAFFTHTCTTSGQRLLRTNLLQPLKDVTSISMRLDALQELLESPHLTLELQALLEHLPKQLDQMCTNLAIREAKTSKDPARQVAALVQAVILLRQLLRCLLPLAESMAWVGSPLLQAVRSNLQHPALQQLLQQVEAVLDEDTQASRAAFMNKVQQCFAVRTEVNSFLDVSRATFSRLTEGVHELADRYREQTGSALQVQYSQARGFFLLIPNNILATGAMDESFIVLEKRSRNTTGCTTHELNALNMRLQDAAADCLMLTEKVLEELVAAALQQMPVLLQAVDSIALLDMMLAFFHAVTGASGEYVRPQLSDVGPLAIRAGRHPLVESFPDVCYQPNDCYISQQVSLHLIGGPNMSGKSTFLKQVATLVVMAQIGCYVPAGFMALRPFDALYTRIGTADNIEANASSFMVEMAEMAGILDRASARSLVIIDELGRATSSMDGVGIAWAMCEFLMNVGATTLLATHFKQLLELEVLYPCCKAWSMQVEVADDALLPQWVLEPAHHPPGSPDHHQQQQRTQEAAVQHYGITLARSAGMPAHVLQRALQVAQQVEAGEAAQLGLAQHCNGLQQATSIIHTLSCIAQELVAAEGPDAAAAGASEGAPREPAAAGAAAAPALVRPPDHVIYSSRREELLQRVMPLLVGLKQRAQQLQQQASGPPPPV